MDGAEYIVIGVFAKAKGGFFGENSQDTQIVLPLHTAESRYPQVDRFMIVSKAKAGMRKQAYDEVEAIIRRVRRTPRDKPNDFSELLLVGLDHEERRHDTGLVCVVLARWCAEGHEAPAASEGAE